MKNTESMLFLTNLLEKYDGDIPRSEIMSYIERRQSHTEIIRLECFWCAKEIEMSWPRGSFHGITCKFCKNKFLCYFGTVKAKRFSSHGFRRVNGGRWENAGKCSLRLFDITNNERLIDILTWSQRNSIEVRAKDKVAIMCPSELGVNENKTIRGHEYPWQEMIIVQNLTINSTFEVLLTPEAPMLYEIIKNNLQY